MLPPFTQNARAMLLVLHKRTITQPKGLQTSPEGAPNKLAPLCVIGSARHLIGITTRPPLFSRAQTCLNEQHFISKRQHTLENLEIPFFFYHVGGIPP